MTKKNSPEDFTAALKDRPVRVSYGMEHSLFPVRAFGAAILVIGLVTFYLHTFLPIQAALSGATEIHYSFRFLVAQPILCGAGILLLVGGVSFGEMFDAHSRSRLKLILPSLAALGLAFAFGVTWYLGTLGYSR